MSIAFNDERLNPKGDHMVVATAWDGQVRLIAVRTTEIVEEARRIHDMSPVSTIALGRLLTGTLLLGSDLKNEGDSLTIQLKAEGPIRGMTVVAEEDGTVRGDIIEPLAEIKVEEGVKPELKEAVGQGMLTVIRDIGMKEPYVGSVELLSGEIGEDLAYYLAASEQIRSVVALGVKLDRNGVRQAGGLLVQLMPGAGKEVEDYIEARAKGFPEVSYWLEEGFTPAQLQDLFMGDPEIQYLAAKPLSYACKCSRERMEANLITLGNDLVEMASDPKGVDLVCHFCRTEYHFTPEELQKLIDSGVRQ